MCAIAGSMSREDKVFRELPPADDDFASGIENLQMTDSHAFLQNCPAAGTSIQLNSRNGCTPASTR